MYGMSVLHKKMIGSKVLAAVYECSGCVCFFRMVKQLQLNSKTAIINKSQLTLSGLGGYYILLLPLRCPNFEHLTKIHGTTITTMHMKKISLEGQRREAPNQLPNVRM